MIQQNDKIDIAAQIEKGVFNIADIDKITIAKISEAKQNLAFSLSSLDLQTAKSQLTDLLTAMQMLLEKYLTPQQIMALTIKNSDKTYTFYDIKNAVPNAPNIEVIRILLLAANQIYENFTKNILKVALPMQKIDKRQALTNNFFRLDT
ncbi:MAG: hypothetical protein ACP5LI_05965 [Hydrogenobaculum sp.]